VVDDIAIAVSFCAFVERDVNAAYDQRLAWAEAVYVIAVAYADWQVLESTAVK
jgi:hypothetical protein